MNEYVYFIVTSLQHKPHHDAYDYKTGVIYKFPADHPTFHWYKGTHMEMLSPVEVIAKKWPIVDLIEEVEKAERSRQREDADVFADV